MSDQAWFWTAEWQAGEQEAAAQLERGEGVTFATAEELLAWLADDDL